MDRDIILVEVIIEGIKIGCKSNDEIYKYVKQQRPLTKKSTLRGSLSNLKKQNRILFNNGKWDLNVN